ncbi:karyogamy protein [Lentithecium fluviatile CBS 122367]|uniref:Karyogamy protein n=1 Tax=Lentithecium fluviatile CBS 122367 TaxID=1168545 RepID=A0A6G1JBT9_9PLEO|nr:karyogamy protein [Lentithecium fluviatile CBS 122367]
MDQSPPPGFESDRSSFVSTSDKVLPSDSEAGDALNEDTQKYRLPDITKTKSLSQTIAETETSSDAELTRAPTPPPKDTPPAEEVSVLGSEHAIDVEAYFQRRHFSRANSIYTISRASFTNQIQQLTSIKLPPPESLSSEISALPSSTAAGRALHSAANSIRLWMAKAAEVLNGLDAEDDVEWAAAAGREGLAEVDAAVGQFEALVNVYITAIEDLQSRPDIASLPTRDLTTLVVQMEDVVNNWAKIKQTLKGIKTQVEIAMEWEELWNTVLGEIGAEVQNLSRLVFEMEERRHRAISDSVAESAEKFDIAELETIVEETPRQARDQTRLQNNRFSMPPALAVMSPISPIPQIEQENSRLLALFAKLQPLRASLDFLPMRLSSFHLRANKMFPSACDELMRRKDQLEKMEKKLEADADALREELGEDKWVHSFRQAGSKAIAMYESLMKSIQRLRQAVNEGDDEKLASRVSTYKDKREHYPPSMKRVLELIDIEMKHRSTVNGEILRIQQDVRQKVSDLEVDIAEIDLIVEELSSNRKLRDSVSTVLSSRTEASLAGSAFDTPNSSPASSIVMSRKSSEHSTITPARKKTRQPSASSSKPSFPASRRYSSLPMATSTGPHKTLTASRLDALASAQPPRAMSSTPTRSARSSTPGSDTASAKPRWNASTNMRDTVVGHNFKPLTLTTPSPHRKETPAKTLRSVSSHSAIPVRSPLSRSSALSPPSSNRPASTTPAQQVTARRPLASPMQSPSTPARNRQTTQTTPGSSSLSASSRRVQIVEEEECEGSTEESPAARRASRPASALNSRRSSMLPTPKHSASLSNIPAMATHGRSTSRFGSIDATPGRSTSRLGSIDEGRRSKLGGFSSGRKSSLEDKRPWR